MICGSCILLTARVFFGPFFASISYDERLKVTLWINALYHCEGVRKKRQVCVCVCERERERERKRERERETWGCWGVRGIFLSATFSCVCLSFANTSVAHSHTLFSLPSSLFLLCPHGLSLHSISSSTVEVKAHGKAKKNEEIQRVHKQRVVLLLFVF